MQHNSVKIGTKLDINMKERKKKHLFMSMNADGKNDTRKTRDTH